MPVVVTGASGFIGRRVVPAFGRVAPEVRAIVRRREAAEELRALGAKVAVGELDDRETLEVVLHGAHTVCHLIGGLVPEGRDEGAYEREIVGSLRLVSEAAVEAGVARILYLSYPGASADGTNRYLKAKGVAERLIADSGLEWVVVRSTHVYGPGSTWLDNLAKQSRAHPSVVLGSGSNRVAPVFVDDVAAVLAAADDRAGRTHGAWGLEGPDRVTADQLADLIEGRERRRVHVGAGVARFARRDLPRDALEVLAADSLADAPDAAAEFGVTRTPLRDGLARSLA